MNKIEEIMKPYFDKKEEIDRLTSNRELEINSIKSRIERLRSNKELEIDEYLKDYADQTSPYYNSVRANLEEAYSKKEEELENELKSLIDGPNYSRVYIREMDELKDELRVLLTKEKRQLELKLKEAEIDFNIVMLNLNKFEPIYDDSHKLLNASDWRDMFDESNKKIDLINSIKKDLKQISDYMELVKPTRDLYTLTPLEQAMYDKRNKKNNPGPTPTGPTSPTPTGPTGPTPTGPTGPTPTGPTGPTGPAPTHTVVEGYVDLVKLIYNEVMKSVESLNAVALTQENEKSTKRIISEGNAVSNNYSYMGEVDLDLTQDVILELPNGQYLNSKEFYRALKNYYKKNKGKTYEVKTTSEKLYLNRKGLRKFKKALKKCSEITLFSRKEQSSYFDIRGVEAKESNDIQNPPNYAVLKDVKARNIPNGTYVNRNELVASLDTLFSTKSSSWLKRLRDRISRKNDEIEIVEEKSKHIK